MEIKIPARQSLNVLLVLSWIIFIGLSIEAGAFIVNAIFAIANPNAVKYLWHQTDLQSLFTYDHGQYFVMNLIISIVACLKATVFLLVIYALHNKDLDLAQPFSNKLRRLVIRLSYVTLVIGLFSWYGVNYANWLSSKGVTMPNPDSLRVSGADVWILMAVVLFIIAQIFKRGIEIQTENDLTI